MAFENKLMHGPSIVFSKWPLYLRSQKNREPWSQALRVDTVISDSAVSKRKVENY